MLKSALQSEDASLGLRLLGRILCRQILHRTVTPCLAQWGRGTKRAMHDQLRASLVASQQRAAKQQQEAEQHAAKQQKEAERHVEEQEEIHKRREEETQRNLSKQVCGI